MTKEQLQMVAEALGWELENDYVKTKGLIGDGFERLGDALLFPEGERAIRGFLIKKGFRQFTLYREFSLPESPRQPRWGCEIKINNGIIFIGVADTPQEALLDACVQYVGGQR